MAGPFDGRSVPEYLCASPLAALVYPLHRLLLHLRGPPRLPGQPIRVVCISDTHTLEWPDIPDGDLLIHAGDLCNDGSAREIQAAVDWLRRLPHPHKVAICGNHDSYFDTRSRLDEDREQSYGNLSSSSASIRSIDDETSKIDWGDIHYLQHSSVTLSFPPTVTQPTTPAPSTSHTANTPGNRTLTIYGAPQVPAIVPFGREHAFVYPAHHDAWSGTIPPETDILITHTPPAAHRDLSPVFSTGCPFLLNEVWRVRPALHVFGHVHVAYGKEPVFWDEAQRAWERICAARRGRAKKFYPPSSSSSPQHHRGRSPGVLPVLWTLISGLMADLVDVSGWVDAARVVGYGVLGVVWARVWGGENRGAGWMVNAACMYRNTGRLGNKPQVVEV